jgi:hypothetical protein
MNIIVKFLKDLFDFLFYLINETIEYTFIYIINFFFENYKIYTVRVFVSSIYNFINFSNFQDNTVFILLMFVEFALIILIITLLISVDTIFLYFFTNLRYSSDYFFFRIIVPMVVVSLFLNFSLISNSSYLFFYLVMTHHLIFINFFMYIMIIFINYKNRKK